MLFRHLVSSSATTFSNSFSSATLVSASLACYCVLQTTPTLRVTSPRLALTLRFARLSSVARRLSCRSGILLARFETKFSPSHPLTLFFFFLGAFPYYHFLLLPRCTWYHRRLRRHRSGLFQQCEAVASRNRSLRLRERE